MDVLQIPSADLAYLGDSVMELLVREHLIRQGHSGAGKLNALARSYVTAICQAQAADRILPCLDETEEGVFRRARNHGKPSPPPSASIAEYRKATALEALFAYLYLIGNRERMRELFEIGYPSETIRDE
ncbi:MAG: Mini-ribonuclease 3 [Eubacteriales bacterium]